MCHRAWADLVELPVVYPSSTRKPMSERHHMQGRPNTQYARTGGFQSSMGLVLSSSHHLPS